jgi:dienelactone hydrolase
MTRILLALGVSFALFPPDPPSWSERLAQAARTPERWKARKAEIRQRILVSAGLWPEFARPPLKPVIFGKVEGEGYTVERVHFETWPGFHLTGSLYRPQGQAGLFPGILSPHGHWKAGRFTQEKDGNLPARGITFARLGFVCFMYDMVGYGDSKQLSHQFQDPAWGVGLLGLQTYNSLRAVDFLSSLPDVDPKRLGCTGASGGGTQTFLLTAVDDRIACSAPVNMVAAEFQGGCSCENAPGLRIDLNNVEIAAAAAPRPLLLVAATGDWTKNVPALEAPAIRGVYQGLGAEDRFRAVQFDAPHNYNKDSREAVYAWMDRWLRHGPDREKIEEPPVPVVPKEDLTVWSSGHALPEGSATPESLALAIHGMVEAQLAALAPKDGPSLKRFREAMVPALRHLLTVRGSPAAPVEARPCERAILFVCTRPEEAAPYAEAARAAEIPSSVLVLREHPRETPSGGNESQRKSYPGTYYRSPLAWQVQDVLDELARLGSLHRNPSIRLVGIGEAGPATLMARATAPSEARVGVTVVELSPEESTAVKEQPGIKRIGGWRTAALTAPPGFLVLHGGPIDAGPLQAAFQGAGRSGALTVAPARMSPPEVAQHLR